jgi:hypothetical protein
MRGAAVGKVNNCILQLEDNLNQGRLILTVQQSFAKAATHSVSLSGLSGEAASMAHTISESWQRY